MVKFYIFGLMLLCTMKVSGLNAEPEANSSVQDSVLGSVPSHQKAPPAPFSSPPNPEMPAPIDPETYPLLESEIAAALSTRKNKGGPPSIFTVNNIALELHGLTTGVQIRDQAITKARRTAFSQLFRKLTLGKTPPAMNDESLSELVLSMTVQEEKISGFHYKGSFTFHFFPEKIRNLLQNMNIAHAESYSKPTVVIPIYVLEGQSLLGEKSNTWYTAWQDSRNSEDTNTLVHMIIPDPGFDELSPKDTEHDINKVILFAHGYQAKFILISVAQLSSVPGKDDYQLLIMERIIDDQGRVHPLPPFMILGNNDTLQSSMNKAVTQSLQRLDKAWKDNNLFITRKESETPVVVKVKELEEWVAISHKLDSVTLLSRYAVRQLTPTSIEVILYHYGDPHHLTHALAVPGLILTNKENCWVLESSHPFAKGPL